MGKFNKCCCCSKSVEEYINTTLLTDFGCSGFTAPNVAPYTHPDIDCVCGVAGPTAAGAWPVPYPAQTFADAHTTINLNTCPQHGYRGVHAHRWINGKPGFLGTSGLLFKKYSVTLGFSESYTGTIVGYNSDGSVDYTMDISGAATASADTSNNVSHNGVSQQTGTWSSYGADTSLYDGSTPMNGTVQFPVAGSLSLWNFQIPLDASANSYSNIKNLCSIDGINGALTIPTPWGVFVGTAANFPAWLASLPSGGSFDPLSNYACSVVRTVASMTVTNTGIDIVINFVGKTDGNEYFYNSDGSVEGVRLETHLTLTGTYSIHCALADESLIADVDADAKSLLNQWNMADDQTWDYAWGTGNCQIQPLVSRRELGYVAPVPGFLPTITDTTALANLATQLAYYDGSIVGAPLSSYRQSDGAYTPGGLTNWPNGYYSTGWFDFAATIYNYSDNGDGTLKLCYGYGTYAAGGLPSQCTQFTTGATDTCSWGGFAPFSRYKVSYVLAQQPPFVWGGGAFVAGCNGNEIFVSKYAEIKEPLPSQNFWAPTSVQPNQAATDPRSWPAPAMRDVNTLDGTCTDTGTKRYPDAVPIAGRAAATFTDNLDGTFNATATAPQLRVGDAVDFINGSSAVITANLAVTALVTGGFKFTGAVPTGATFMVSHGHATDWQWFDITPKGDFVLAFFTSTAGTNEATAIQGNVQPNGQKYAVICICPPGSPELTDARWQNGNVYFYTGYPVASAFNSWQANIVQGMQDRLWIDHDDNQTQVAGVCQAAGYTVPLVEARLTAPVGAPLQFTTASADRWNAMPTQDSFSIACSGIWGYGEKMQAFTKPLDPPAGTSTVSDGGAGAAATGGGANVAPSAGDENLGAGDDNGGGGL